MSTIMPCLWSNGQAEEMANFYTSIFKNSHIGNIARYPEGSPVPAGTVLTAKFTIDDQEFMIINGGPEFSFSEAISFYVSCETQAEIDRMWAQLTADGGEEGPCGWLKDKFGLSWQIAPPILGELLQDPDPAKSKRVMETMLQMKKIDISALKQAYEG